jgi:hypothetical protein
MDGFNSIVKRVVVIVTMMVNYLKPSIKKYDWIIHTHTTLDPCVESPIESH